MRYRNIKTGVIIESACQISGGNWEPVKVPTPPAPAPAQEEKPRKASTRKAKA